MVIVNLRILRDLILLNTPLKDVRIETCWEDYGAGIKHDTLVSYDDILLSCGSYQMLCPRDTEKLRKGTFTINDAENVVAEIKLRGW